MPQQKIQVEDQRNFWFCFLDIAIMTDESLSAYDKAVYAALCSYASTGGRSCYPSVTALAKRAGCSYRTAHRSLRILEEKGYIHHQYRGEIGQTSIYTLKGGVTQGQGGCATQTHPVCQTGTENYSHRTIATNDKEPTPSEGASAPAGREKADDPQSEAEGQKQRERGDLSCGPEDVPEVMRPTAELLMLKTDRKGLSPGEVSAFRALEKAHTPARVQKELLKAEERFKRRGRPMEELTAEYLLESLKHQTSRRGTGTRKAKGGRGNARSGDGGGSHEKLPDQYSNWWEDQKRAASVSGAGLDSLPETGGETGSKP